MTLAERGSAYLAIHAHGMAEKNFEAALKVDSTIASASAGLALVRAFQHDLALAEQDAERACRAGPMTQRIAWLTARTFAVSYGQLAARGSLLSLDEGSNKVRYRRRAMELLDQSVALTAADQRASFWRDAIQSDPWLRLLSDQPRYIELQEMYPDRQQRRKGASP